CRNSKVPRTWRIPRSCAWTATLAARCRPGIAGAARPAGLRLDLRFFVVMELGCDVRAPRRLRSENRVSQRDRVARSRLFVKRVPRGPALDASFTQDASTGKRIVDLEGAPQHMKDVGEGTEGEVLR